MLFIKLNNIYNFAFLWIAFYFIKNNYIEYSKKIH